PVLFPIVGGLKDGTYRYGGREYRLGQHGFARDMEFELASKTENEIWHRLVSSEATKEVYPFDFELETGFRLFRNQVIALWRVQNRSDGEMYFSIGGHPAFLLPPASGAEPRQGLGELLFEGVSVLNTRMLENGLACRGLEQLELTRREIGGKQYGAVAVTEHFFDRDAYIIEGHQTREAALAGPDGSVWLSVKFDAPLFGVWAPKGNAPFVCIEPWYGRCDGVDADQRLENKEYINRLEPGQVFSKNYHICIY
nr:aldose 1-epimerase family protein [Lachnospiraceae bacterium]